MTNPTPSLGLSSKDTPPQAALAAAKDIFGPVESGVWLSEEECAKVIDKHFAQLAETNGKALADLTAGLEFNRDQRFEYMRTCTELERKLAAEIASSEEVHALLAQSQAREASLASANASLAEALKPFANYACEPEDLKGAHCDCHNCNARAALARHQAAVDSSAVEGKTP